MGGYYWGSMMVNFMGQFEWDTGPKYLIKHYSGVFLEMR